MKYITRFEIFNESISNKKLFDRNESVASMFENYFESLGIFTKENYRRTKYGDDRCLKNEYTAEVRTSDYMYVLIYIKEKYLILHLYSYQNIDNYQRRGRMMKKLLTNFDNIQMKEGFLDLIQKAIDFGFKPIVKVAEDTNSGSWFRGTDPHKDKNILKDLYDEEMFNESALEVGDNSWCYILPYFLKYSNKNIIKKWWNKMSVSPKRYKVSEELKKLGKEHLVGVKPVEIDNSATMGSMGFAD